MESVLLLCLSLCFSPGPPEEAPEAVERLFREYDYERELPRMREIQQAGASGAGGTPVDPNELRDPDESERSWDRTTFERGEFWEREREEGNAGARDDMPRRRRDEPLPSGGGSAMGLGGLLEVLLWVALAVAAILILSAILSRFSDRKDKKPKRKAPQIEAAPDTRASLAAPRSHAEQLASEGAYAEAVHVLLLETIEALRSTQPGEVPDAWTSREIQQAVPMPDSARPAFEALVDAVEASLFAGAPVDEQQWQNCHQLFQQFEQAYQGAPA